MSIGTNIRRRRYELSMSQQDLATAMGYKTRSTIAKIESDQNSVTYRKLSEFAKVLDTTVEELTSFTDSVTKECSLEKHDDSKAKNIAVILAGGKSSRNRQNIPNQFISVQGKPLILFTLEAYQKHPSISEIYIVCLKGWEEILKTYCKKITKLKAIFLGGESGILSVKNAIEQIDCPKDSIIVLQESTRPLVSQEMISRLLYTCEAKRSTVISESMNDYVQFTKVQGYMRPIDRMNTVNLESPEAHYYIDIKNAFSEAEKKHAKYDETCCALFMYNMGYELYFLEGIHNNIKVVRQDDLIILNALLKNKEILE